jgi:hypothetical protein
MDLLKIDKFSLVFFSRDEIRLLLTVTEWNLEFADRSPTQSDRDLLVNCILCLLLSITR